APGGRSGGAGPGEPPADVQTRVFAGGRPGRPDNLAPPLGQERQDRVWCHVGRAAQQPGLTARLTAARPQRDDLDKQLHDTISAAFIAITLMAVLPPGHAYQSRFLAVAAERSGGPTSKAGYGVHRLTSSIAISPSVTESLEDNARQAAVMDVRVAWCLPTGARADWVVLPHSQPRTCP